jgi:hypothetical protein
VTTRVFLKVKRGMTDATAVCVYPWEKRLLEMIHGQDVQEVSIDEMAEVKDGVVKVEMAKLNYSKFHGPNLRQQLEGMAYVDPESDPGLDPAGEYNRLAEKYGMDKELPMLVVERVYGQFDAGGFEKILAEAAQQTMPKPSHMKAVDEGLPKPPDQMKIGELRDALNERGVEYERTDGKKELRAKLEEALVE